MDKFWSVAAMPIGLFLCFTPIVIAWVLESMKGTPAPAPAPRKTDRRD